MWSESSTMTIYNGLLSFVIHSKPKVYRLCCTSSVYVHLRGPEIDHFPAVSTCMYVYVVNPLAPGNFAKKCILTYSSRAVFWSLSCYKELKLTIKSVTGRSLCGLLIQMQLIFHHFEIHHVVFGFKSETVVLTFTFHFLPSPLLSLCLLQFCFFFWAFSRLHFGGKTL